MNQKIKNVLIIMFLTIIFVGITGAAFICQHKETYTTIMPASTCTIPGQENVICCRCDDIVEMHIIPATGHDWGEFVITKLPTKNTNGTQMRICYTCQDIEETEYVCSHFVTEDYVAKEPSCIIEGLREWKCTYCETVIKQESIPVVECTFSDWTVTKTATPIDAGQKTRTCLVCSNKETKGYTMSMAGENAIYIPGSGINNNVSISSFTQWAVDKYDIVYTESAMENGSNNPFVLGHNTRTLGALPKTRVGQFIYLSIGGKIEVYKVRISEAARLTNYGQDIVGNTTGASLWDTYSGKTLHMYTCYGSGRWLVLAQKVK